MGGKMNALAPAVPKIVKLIPRLASNHDGEVIATVRAIERTLKSAGVDLHALARALEKEPNEKVVVIYRDRETDEPNTWSTLSKWCRENDCGALSPKERKFVRDMGARLVCGGEPTEKQAAWLRAIYAKLKKVAA